MSSFHSSPSHPAGAQRPSGDPRGIPGHAADVPGPVHAHSKPQSPWTKLGGLCDALEDKQIWESLHSLQGHGSHSSSRYVRNPRATILKVFSAHPRHSVPLPLTDLPPSIPSPPLHGASREDSPVFCCPSKYCLRLNRIHAVSTLNPTNQAQFALNNSCHTRKFSRKQTRMCLLIHSARVW